LRIDSDCSFPRHFVRVRVGICGGGSGVQVRRHPAICCHRRRPQRISNLDWCIAVMAATKPPFGGSSREVVQTLRVGEYKSFKLNWDYLSQQDVRCTTQFFHIFAVFTAARLVPPQHLLCIML